jgi:MFS transporter, DHA2 family, multidrug resistance protein
MSASATTFPFDSAGWRPSANPWLIAISVMTATFMEVLDTSVANVALQHIAGSLSVSSDEATWVLTSYLVSNAVILPATGWLGRYFGRRRFLIACIAVFTFASALCGMADSLGMLIVARILQGIGGGALQPVSQAVMLETFPPEKRGISMSVFSIGVIVAPILGPTLGGWLTDDYSWRWVFYINLPVGIFAVTMCLLFLEDPPYLKTRKTGNIDFIGFGLLAIWIGCLQIMLDKGQDEDWFSSLFIRWLAAGASIGLLAFIVWELKVKNPIVSLKVLCDRNLGIATFLMFLIGGILYSTTAILPRFLQTLLDYPALQSGLVLSPRGIGSIIGAIVAGQILSRTKIDGRYWMCPRRCRTRVVDGHVWQSHARHRPWECHLANRDQRVRHSLYFCSHDNVFGGDDTKREHSGCHRNNQSGKEPGRLGRNFFDYNFCNQRNAGSPSLASRPSRTP